jgi:glucosamine--fructose-6-phosphate aminotransferase (isomerizing)
MSAAGRPIVGRDQPKAGRVAPEGTMMFREAAEAADVVRRQLEQNAGIISELAARLRTDKPRAVVTLARGSSDHAATFARYLVETRAGVLTSSASPSVGSVYEATPDLAGTILLVISQSGRSPDLLNAATMAVANGALLVAMVNDENSPLAKMAEFFVPLHAGPERSVAASKSFIASLAATLDLLAAWTEDAGTRAALSELPDKLAASWALDWTQALPQLCDAQAMYVVGRGHGLGIAQEAALKLKETCGIHAEAFSAAELRHGPMAVVREGFPVLLFGQPDESLESVATLAGELAAKGARVLSAGVPDAPGIRLPTVEANPLITPVLQITSFYHLANALSAGRGRDPDRPPHLAKITETL